MKTGEFEGTYLWRWTQGIGAGGVVIHDGEFFCCGHLLDLNDAIACRGGLATFSRNRPSDSLMKAHVQVSITLFTSLSNTPEKFHAQFLQLRFRRLKLLLLCAIGLVSP